MVWCRWRCRWRCRVLVVWGSGGVVGVSVSGCGWRCGAGVGVGVGSGSGAGVGAGVGSGVGKRSPTIRAGVGSGVGEGVRERIKMSRIFMNIEVSYDLQLLDRDIQLSLSCN